MYHHLSRRSFLYRLAAIGTITVGGRALAACSSGDAPTTLPPAVPRRDDLGPIGRLLPGRIDRRILVIVDLQGGNDGLSTLIPLASGRYRDLRPGLGSVADDALELDEEMGLHPSLARLHRRGLTTVEGVGPMSGDLSHSAMTERWERGDVDGRRRHRTGFLGRLTDALVQTDNPDQVLVGASLAGSTPHLVNQLATNVALAGTDDLWFLEPPEWAEAKSYQDGLRAMRRGVPSTGEGHEHQLALIAAAYGELAVLGRRLSGQTTEIDWESTMLSEGGDLGRQLRVAADLIAADVGLQVVYTRSGDYDTHSGHEYQQQANLAQLDAAADGFLALMDDQGRADEVLVATTSEFGRRVEEHNGGLDHGSASTMLLAGAVGNVRRGERPGLDDLDDDGNLKVAIGFDRYLASLAEEWLGIEAESVLSDGATPLGIV